MSNGFSLSQRAGLLKPSETLSILARAKQMKAEGIDVVALSAGEPDFPTPEHIRRAAVTAMEEGKTTYTPPAGIPELRKAAAGFMSELCGTSYEWSQLVITNGAKQGLFNAFFCLLDPGDEVLIPAPCWVSYPAQVNICGGKTRVVPPRPDGTVDVSAVAAAMAGAKVLVLCNPSNPSGEVLGREALAEMGAAAREHGTVVLADEVYSQLVYGETEFTPFLRACPDMVDYTVALHSVSKAFSMTGWRIGWAACPAALAAKMGALMSQSTSNPCSISQWGALAALRGSTAFFDEWRAAFHRRRDLVVDGLNAIPGIECLRPDGAFYVFPQVRGLLEKLGMGPDEDVKLAGRILDEAHVASVPGSPFCAPGHIRLSYATSEADLEKALERIAKWVAES